jgi:putative cardiolipin synthase
MAWSLVTDPMRVRNVCWHSLLLAGVLLLCGCVSVPFDYPKTASTALPPNGSTPLGQTAQQWQQEHGELSGFIGLPNGIDALGARLRMIEAAQSTIDAQYFIVKKDRAGALFVGKMLRAADRGVRVRLLVDDIFSPGVDQGFSLLNSHPNVEVRLFNPLSRQSFRYWSYLVDFKRANRRMHNKSFTVDNSMTIVGGRNIGEEYFELKQDIKFDDYEVFAIGPVVEQVSQGFDEFWNSELAVPMEAFDLAVDSTRLDEWREYVRIQVEDSEQGIYSKAVTSTLLQEVQEGRVKPVVAPASMVTDSPEKLQNAVGEVGRATLAVEMARRFRAAQHEIIIVSPYYIPQDQGAELIEELLAKGIRVIVITNSLASTNHVPVHSGYARYRKRLLQAGVEFFEIRADVVDEDSEWGHRPEMVTLHSKATIIDRSTIFVGSLNFDPRSIKINTEMGLFIESAEAGTALTQAILDDLPRVTYKVELDERGKLRWTYRHGDISEVAHKEPLTSWWRRFQVGFYRLLPIEGQL